MGLRLRISSRLDTPLLLSTFLSDKSDLLIHEVHINHSPLCRCIALPSLGGSVSDTGTGIAGATPGTRHTTLLEHNYTYSESVICSKDMSLSVKSVLVCAAARDRSAIESTDTLRLLPYHTTTGSATAWLFLRGSQAIAK